MTVSQHAEWLSLIEVSGPFLAVSVLEESFPQGLDILESNKRQRLRRAYDEWRDAVDEADPQLNEIHREWIRLVLEEVLEFDNDVLKSQPLMPESLLYKEFETGVITKPDLAVMAGDKARLLISVYPPGTDLESSRTGDGWPASPAERMTLLCRATGVRLGLVTDGERWMLVNASVGATAGYTSWYARLWRHEPITLQAFQSLLGVRRFFGPEDENLESLLEESFKHQEEVTDTLGEQVRRAVEVLVQALDRADIDRNRELLRDVQPEELYEAGLTVMMRLVFLLCAEERGLLLLGESVYDQCYAVSTLRAQLHEEADRVGLEVLERRHDSWSRLLAVFRAVYYGIEHEILRMPALGGSLFDPDRYPFLEGRAKGTTWNEVPAVPLPIDNRTVLMLLRALQVLEQRSGALLLSYRALDVEQIGHVYEGLLEHTVTRLPQTTLGLVGSQRFKNPNVTLSELESARLDGERILLDLLVEKTGRSEPALRNALSKSVDDVVYGKVLQACGSDATLATRIRPFAHLLRTDSWGDPLVYREKAFAVTLGTNRRETGTHYTPKSLTEAIVAETLEPVVYAGPADGSPREEWQLKNPAELLELKVCDPAMGSGAFLVQVCRQVADYLLKAWEQEEKIGKVITVDGLVLDDAQGFESLPKDTDERLLIARRLVAERCLYGVDMNPLAVELAKLSIWLVTLAKGRPFGFLNHNLRHGDSMLGIHQLDQLIELNMSPSTSSGPRSLFGQNIERAVGEAVKLRKRLREIPIRDIQDVRAMAMLNAEACRMLEGPERVADALVGEALKSGKDFDAEGIALQSLAIEADSFLDGNEEAGKTIARRAKEALGTDLPPDKTLRKPFHWPLEFPEVFTREDGGFDAIMGNPPFLGGKRITSVVGSAYREYLVRWLADGTRGSADLVAYFFLRVHQILRQNACFGLLAVNTIAEGDTRQVGLEKMIRTGSVIFAAYPNEPWPGKAAVVTSRIHLIKGDWHGECTLSGLKVRFISVFLSDQEEWSPNPLKANAGKSFIGSYILGLGFLLSEEEAHFYLDLSQTNAEVLFPYLNGDDLNTSPNQKASRWIVNFWDWPLSRDREGNWSTASEKEREVWLREGQVPSDFPGRVADDFPEILKLVEERVKPERQRKNKDNKYALRKPLPQRWWQFADKRPALYHAIGRGRSFWNHPENWNASDRFFKRVLVRALNSKHHTFAFISAAQVIDQTLNVFAIDDDYDFALLSSEIHGSWFYKQGSSLGASAYPRYIQTDIFLTFPAPDSDEVTRSELTALGIRLGQVRRTLMDSFNIGLTRLFNRISNPSDKDSLIQELRNLHTQIDETVATAYGWNDLALGHGFHEVPYLPENDQVRFTISESARKEVLRRLAELNLVRFEAEVALGLHDSKTRKVTSRGRRSSHDSKTETNSKGQPALFTTSTISGGKTRRRTKQ
ncbi:MAG TPA: hypothetical protein VGC66_00570 [Pyrinomonadaceae bacterium]|jgi:hypothetical protein